MNSMIGYSNYKFKIKHIIYPIIPSFTPLALLCASAKASATRGKGSPSNPLCDWGSPLGVRGSAGVGISPLGARGSAGIVLFKCFIITVILLFLLTSCEEVINVDLNSADPAFVVEAKIYKDSVSLVRLTTTTSYFSPEDPGIIEDASVTISDGNSTDKLKYMGNGYYRGDTIIGTEEKTYQIEINHDGKIYKGVSTMPHNINLINVRFGKSNAQSIFNPTGETVFTITCVFLDNPETENYYMIRYLEDGEMIEKNYFMLTQNDAVGGTFTNSNDTISFSESIFYEGGIVDVEVFAIDKPVYDFFLQMNDVLFWKRRVMPPTPYNPVSNIDNGALGYFTAWAYDSERIVLE